MLFRSNLRVSCPNCGHHSSSWNVHPAEVSGRRGEPTKHRLRRPVNRSDRFDHPVSYFASQDPQWQSEHTIISLAKKVSPNSSGYLTFSSELYNDDPNENHVDDANDLEDIGCALHSILLPKLKHSSNDYLMGGEDSLHKLERDDTSLLRRFVHAIATGDKLFNNPPNDSIAWQREKNASYVATDLIRTLRGGGWHGSPLKELISTHLYIGNVNDLLFKLFSNICLSQSKKTLSLSSGQAVKEKIAKGWSTSGRRWGLLVGASDNMGLRAKIQYIQYTCLMMFFISHQWLIKNKFYPDPQASNPTEAWDKCYSHARREWEEVRAHYSFQIERADDELLAEHVTLPTIQL